MTYNTFNYLNDHIHIHIPSNTHQFLFYFVFILFLYIFWSRGYWVQFFGGGLCQFGCNIGSIQLEHLTSLSIHEACRGRGDEYRDFKIHKNLGQFVIDNNNDVASSNKKHPFQLLPSCGNNIQFTYWNCLLLILNISKKLFSFITRNFGFNWELRFSFKYRYHSFAENLKKSHN